jgi:Concanavalin A-like lectin/glucanases superfamily
MAPTWIIAGEEDLAGAIATVWTGPTSGLINQWWLDSSHVIGISVVDSVGGNNGGAFGNVFPTFAPPNAFYTGPASARGFDGVAGTYIQLQTHNFFDWNNNAFSFGVWLYQQSNSALGSGSTNPTFFDVDFSSNGTNYIRVLNDIGSVGAGALGLSKSGGADGLVSAAGTMPSTTWTHMLYTTTGPAGTNTLYINGAAVTTTNETATVGANGTAMIGAESSTLGTPGAAIYNIVIYNRALAAIEAMQLFNAK